MDSTILWQCSISIPSEKVRKPLIFSHFQEIEKWNVELKQVYVLNILKITVKIVEIMCHNPGTWHNCSQVKLTSKERCQRTKCKTNHTWKQSCKSHLGTIVSVLLGNNRASLAQEQLYQSHLGTTLPFPLGNNYDSVTSSNSASLTWEQFWQCHLGAILPAQFRSKSKLI